MACIVNELFLWSLLVPGVSPSFHPTPSELLQVRMQFLRQGMEEEQVKQFLGIQASRPRSGVGTFALYTYDYDIGDAHILRLSYSYHRTRKWVLDEWHLIRRREQ
jgi:hypothetical protein